MFHCKFIRSNSVQSKGFYLMSFISLMCCYYYFWAIRIQRFNFDRAVVLNGIFKFSGYSRNLKFNPSIPVVLPPCSVNYIDGLLNLASSPRDRYRIDTGRL